jgi:hypothetical protein
MLLAALALLNGSLTFVSVWPTLAVRPALVLSLEACALVLALALWRRWRVGGPSSVALRLLAIGWCVLVVAHYLEITTRALYGRSVNLYWDLTLVPDVGAMFAAVANPLVLLVVLGVLVIVPLLLYVPLRWAIGTVNAASGAESLNRGLVAAAALVIVAGIAVQRSEEPPFAVAPLVTASMAQEVVEFAREVRGVRDPLPPAPSTVSDLAFVQGADVVLLFVASYGVTSWERPEFVSQLAASRTNLLESIAGTRRSLVSARVDSTTFGGESWLAHISLLSGTAVRDQATNRRLMAEPRDTLVTTFARAGYRTLGVFPGLHAPWPEGRFYGFDRIVTRPDLAYAGPPFGWWDVTDQFVLARTDAIAMEPASPAPVFVFLPTISTHTPFTPVPPYQPDWPRVLTAQPYDEAALVAAYDAEPDWENLGPDYVRALAYLHDTVSGYLREHTGRDLVLVVVGDHQPPALVSGEGASWQVPVHVITDRPIVLERLRARGFRDGLEPPVEVLAGMDALMRILLDGFGNAG